jgi:hypothetical protein
MIAAGAELRDANDHISRIHCSDCPQVVTMSQEPAAFDGLDDFDDQLAEVRELLREFSADVDQLVEREAA